MSKLLINEPALQVLPSLAKAVGLNEAIILQQVHYWLINPKVGREFRGRKYVRNSIAEWKENFPFWSETAIKRALTNLAADGLLESIDELNQMAQDRTLWYTINYDLIDKLPTSRLDARREKRKLSRATQGAKARNVPLGKSTKRTRAKARNVPTITIDYKEENIYTGVGFTHNGAAGESVAPPLHSGMVYEHNPADEIRSTDEWELLRAAVCEVSFRIDELVLSEEDKAGIDLLYGKGATPAEIRQLYSFKDPTCYWRAEDFRGRKNQRITSIRLIVNTFMAARDWYAHKQEKSAAQGNGTPAAAIVGLTPVAKGTKMYLDEIGPFVDRRVAFVNLSSAAQAVVLAIGESNIRRLSADELKWQVVAALKED